MATAAENQQAKKAAGNKATEDAESAESRRAALAEAEQEAAREAALPRPGDETGKEDHQTARGYAQDDSTGDGVESDVDARVLLLAKTLEGYVSTNGQETFDEALELVRQRGGDFVDSAERRARAAREDVQAGMGKAPEGRKQEVKKTT